MGNDKNKKKEKDWKDFSGSCLILESGLVSAKKSAGAKKRVKRWQILGDCR